MAKKEKIENQLKKELGCSLEVVVKALKNGIYIKDLASENKLIYEPSVLLSTIKTKWFLSDHRTFCVGVDDYKRFWWLKEDKSE